MADFYAIRLCMKGNYVNGSSLRIACMVSSVFAAIFATPASAQALNDDYWIEAGVFFPRIDTDLIVSSKVVDIIGTESDLESDLGLKKSSSLFAASAGARLTRNLAVAADFYNIGRKGEVSLADELVFEDVTYPVSASVRTRLDSDIFRLTLNYSLIREENFEFGVGAGLHITDFTVQIEGEGSIGDAAASFETRKHKVTAPLPTVGLYATTEVAPRLTLETRAEYLSLKVGDYKGRLVNTQISATYRAFENVGIGIAFRHVNYRLKVDKRDWFGRYDYRFSGPAVFLRAGF